MSIVRVRGRRPDVVFRRAGLSEHAESPAEVLTRPHYRAERYADGQFRFYWPGIFECVLSADGADVAVHPLSDDVDQAFTTHLFGHVLSFVLLKRGIEPLHATVLGAPDGAVGILGDSGFGKSTLAAALIDAGLHLITDDLLVLRSDSGVLMAQPGLPRLKLLPEAAAVFLPGSPSRPMAPGVQKRIYPIDPPAWDPDPRPLKALYVLRRPVIGNRTTRVTIRDVPRKKAFVDITRNTFNSWVVDPGRLRGQFRFASDLTSRIPVRSLTYPPGYDELPRVASRLLHDASRDG